ncbi:MAG: RrF2 family transcriptional regulator [Acidimicrobiales bacterium]
MRISACNVTAAGVCHTRPVRISHKVDYGVRAMMAVATAEGRGAGALVTRDSLARHADVPPGFLDDILRALRTAGLAKSPRGPAGGWELARPAATITVAEIIRALDGPLASVRGVRPHDLPAIGVSEPLVSLWLAVRVALRSVLST